MSCFDTKILPLFDVIICSHVLEHLYFPKKFLTELKNNLSDGGRIIVALPNVVHWKQRLEFLKGKFRYTETGILDRTHYRFYDRQTVLDLVKSAGLNVTAYEVDGYFPLSLVHKLLPSLVRSVTYSISPTNIPKYLLGAGLL